MPGFASLQDGPLSESEIDRLTGFLESRGGQAMNFEELDGFFAALVAGPGLVLPSEYLPLVWGSGDATEAAPFAGIEEANEILGLIMRHWNGIAATLRKGDAHLPILLEDDRVAPGNDWARDFIRGTRMRGADWARLFNDEEHGGCMIPAMALYHEHDDDPEMRPPPIGPEQRERIIVEMAAGVVRAYRYFQNRAATPFRQAPKPGPESPGKTGRNELCPCGSGKKYKRCCGGAIIN